MINLRFAAFATATALGVAMAGAGGAGAETVEKDAPSVALHYSASSLDTDQGVRHLYNRLRLAAERVCPQSGSPLFQSAAVIECRKQAVARAVAQIHNTRLAELSRTSNRIG